MNPQGKGKIEWTDFTWSPVTGCKHGCSYCYANRIAQRIYPEKFQPTFRADRLYEPLDLKKPSRIFVSDMGDLFGEWIPNDWVGRVLDIVRRCPQHTFQFLTKNPSRYEDFSFPKNCWLGTTWDGLPLTQKNIEHLCDAVSSDNVSFISFEPLLVPYRGELPVDALDWIIIGELTGVEHSIEEKRDILGWAQDILHQAQDLEIPIFFKNWLGTMFSQREFPR